MSRREQAVTAILAALPSLIVAATVWLNAQAKVEAKAAETKQ